jgi:hypothetical protein
VADSWEGLSLSAVLADSRQAPLPVFLQKRGGGAAVAAGKGEA